jgi:hypothetical protein
LEETKLGVRSEELGVESQELGVRSEELGDRSYIYSYLKVKLFAKKYTELPSPGSLTPNS